MLELSTPLGQKTPNDPEAPDRRSRAKADFSLTLLNGPGECEATIIVFHLDQVQPLNLVRRRQMRLRRLGKIAKIAGVRFPHVLEPTFAHVAKTYAGRKVVSNSLVV